MSTSAGFLIATALFVALAWLVLRWTQADYEQNGSLTTKSVIAGWVLYLLHADTVGLAAYADVGRLPIPAGPSAVVGGAIALGGFALFARATYVLGRDGDFDGFKSRSLVTAWPYGAVRHPQSLGWLLLLTGLAVASRSVIALGLVGLFAVFAHYLAALEDRDLQVRFGDA